MLIALFIMVWLLRMVGPPAMLIWATKQWWLSSPRIVAPAGRSYFAVYATALVGLSELLWVSPPFGSGLAADLTIQGSNGFLSLDSLPRRLAC